MIKSAAIKLGDKIYTGSSHNDIHLDNKILFNEGADGFVDENGKFYDRHDAAKEAVRCGQITNCHYLESWMIK